MIRRKLKLSLSALLLILAGAATGQEILKHPRVVELEDVLKDSASEYIKARFPDIPFMVFVRVDPLRRELGRRGAQSTADLPYFDIEDEEEILDEWDNPQYPLKALINRTKRITVSLSVPAKLRESEVNELKDSIFNVLHLTPARDQVDISRRDWVMEETPWLLLGAGAGVVFALLLGLLLINKAAANRIARALTEIKINTGGSGGSAPAPASPIEGAGSAGKAPAGELTFNDPIKMKELASRHVAFLAAESKFPNHLDIFLLDRLGRRDPEKLGAILAEFPAETQALIFAYSSGLHWIEALNSPGFLDFECLETVQALTQNPRKGDDLSWDRAVLAVWRLDENRTRFIKQLSRDEAFAVLSDLPKAVAVQEARRAFPGAWGTLLDPDFVPAAVPEERVKAILAEATRLVPLNPMDLVRRYRAERELIEYLGTVDPDEERDIYGALDENSMVPRVRPPFFLVLDQPDEILKWLVPMVRIDQWALALFNLPKPERSKVDSHMSEKQRFLLVEFFKKYDSNTPDIQSIRAAREKIAMALNKYLAERRQADQMNFLTDQMMAEASSNENKAA